MSRERAEQLRTIMAETIAAHGGRWDWERNPRLVVPMMPRIDPGMVSADFTASPVLPRVEFERQRRTWWRVSAHAGRDRAAPAKPVQMYDAQLVVADGLIIEASYFDPQRQAWVPMPEQIGEPAPV